MATEPLGQRIDDDVRTMFDGAQQIRCRKRRVDDQGDAVLVRDVGNRRDIGHVQYWVTDRFDEDGSRTVSDGRREVLGVPLIDKLRRDSELWQDTIELAVGSAVQITRRHNLVASLCQGDN